MALRCITPPTVEPITVDEVKVHLREVLQDTGIDLQLGAAIKGTREVVENDTRRSLLTQKWRLTLDAFPRPSMNVSSATWYGPQWGNQPGPLLSLQSDGTSGYEIWLPYPPLQSLDLISYIDQDGNAQTMNVGTAVLLDSESEPARVMPAYGTMWPATRQQANAVTIEFTTGYGATADKVPAAAKMYMLAMIGAAYENRELEVLAMRGTIQHFPFLDRLLDPLRIRKY